jgi:hypothetical protein
MSHDEARGVVMSRQVGEERAVFTTIDRRRDMLGAQRAACCASFESVPALF